jgi:hypothetical protein
LTGAATAGQWVMLTLRVHRFVRTAIEVALNTI